MRQILLDKREKVYYQFHRTDWLLGLYSECMADENLYIPRKFRQDKTHRMNESETNVIKKLEHQRNIVIFKANTDIFDQSNVFSFLTK